MIGEDNAESGEMQQIWANLSPDQKKYFKKIAEKSEENLKYIG